MSNLEKKVASLLVSVLLLASMLILAFNIRLVQAGIVTVPDDYSTIQEAINAADEGDTVLVKAGTYSEHVFINKSISLIGEDREATVIDGNGIGTVVSIGVNNVSIINFTIRNAGKVWTGVGYPDSCIRGNGVRWVHIENNTLTDAAVCIWFYSSSFVNITNNIIFDATVAGIIGYASSNITIHQNNAYNCGLMGLHLDGSSTDCNITGNTVMNTLEGIEIEKSAGNFVVKNQLIDNNVSMVLNQCNGLNNFRGNNMSSDWYNIIVWGWAIEAFMQDFDTTNIVNGKSVYYFINSNSLLVNPSSYPNIGYLAIVNCTGITIKDTNLSFNKDGLLLAQSTNCSLTNITLSGNQGLLLHGGLTFFRSNNNMIVGNRISNNTVGICLYQSNSNTFYHNSFIDINNQIISNFHSPFSPPSGSYSQNIWDNGYPSGGNYWSTYIGVDRFSGSSQNETGSDGISDDEYVIDANNTDRYPLMAAITIFEAGTYNGTAYTVDIVSNSTVSYFHFDPDEGAFLRFNVTGENGTTGFCRVTIPNDLLWVEDGQWSVLVDDELVNYTIIPDENYTYLYFTYNHTTKTVLIQGTNVISEFPSSIALLGFLILTTIPLIFAKKKRFKKGKI